MAGDTVDLDRLRIDEEEGSGKGKPAGKGGFIAAFVVGAALGLAAGFVLARERAKSNQAAPTRHPPVVRGTVRKGSGAFTAGGWIEVPAPDYPIIVSSRISQRLDKLMVRQGDDVKPGQVIARLYDGDAQARVQRAEARVREREEKFRLAKATHKRSAALEEGAISVEEADRDLAGLNIAKEQVATAAAELDLARKELSYCTISVPEGLPILRVLDVFHSPGEWIAVDRKAPVVSLYDPANMQARVDVPQAKIRFVKKGQAVKVVTEANPGHEYSGAVSRIDPLAELAKNTITVRIRIDRPDNALFPEMVAHVTFLPDKGDK